MKVRDTCQVSGHVVKSMAVMGMISLRYLQCCFPRQKYRAALALCNKGKKGVRVTLHAPAEVGTFLSFRPNEVVLLPGPSRLVVYAEFAPTPALLQQPCSFKTCDRKIDNPEPSWAVEVPCQVDPCLSPCPSLQS